MIPLIAISFNFVNPCSQKSRYVSKAPTAEDVVYDVEVIYPEFRSVAQVYDVEGVFDVSELLTITANANGQVEQVFLSVGDRVEEKDPVVAISNLEILDRTELMRLKVKELSTRLRQTEGGFEEIDTEDRPVTHDEVAFLDDDDIVGEEAKKKNFVIFEELRKAGIKAIESLGKESLKSQLRAADRAKVLLTLIIGQKEVFEESVIIRNMETGNQEAVSVKRMAEEVKKRLH